MHRENEKRSMRIGFLVCYDSEQLIELFQFALGNLHYPSQDPLITF